MIGEMINEEDNDLREACASFFFITVRERERTFGFGAGFGALRLFGLVTSRQYISL